MPFGVTSDAIVEPVDGVDRRVPDVVAAGVLVVEQRLQAGERLDLIVPVCVPNRFSFRRRLSRLGRPVAWASSCSAVW